MINVEGLRVDYRVIPAASISKMDLRYETKDLSISFITRVIDSLVSRIPLIIIVDNNYNVLLGSSIVQAVECFMTGDIELSEANLLHGYLHIGDTFSTTHRSNQRRIMEADLVCYQVRAASEEPQIQEFVSRVKTMYALD